MKHLWVHLQALSLRSLELDTASTAVQCPRQIQLKLEVHQQRLLRMMPHLHQLLPRAATSEVQRMLSSQANSRQRTSRQHLKKMLTIGWSGTQSN